MRVCSVCASVYVECELVRSCSLPLSDSHSSLVAFALFFSHFPPFFSCSQPSSSASSSQCVCNNGWSGVDCGERACPDDCSRHGECHAGICRCDLAWTGENCAAPRCDADCHGHGSCTKGVCKCFADWSFDSNCAYPSCPRGRHGAATARSLNGVGSHHGTVSVGIGEECRCV